MKIKFECAPKNEFPTLESYSAILVKKFDEFELLIVGNNESHFIRFDGYISYIKEENPESLRKWLIENHYEFIRSLRNTTLIIKDKEE